MHNEIRLVREEDAEFIVKLRTDSRLTRFLSKTSSNVEKQVEWIKEYIKKEEKQEEFYFLILENGIKRGLYRLYKINNISFTIGSWLFDVCENKKIPIMTDLIIADFGYYKLNKDILLLDVRKENKKVINYHLLKKPLIYTEDELNYYYLIIKQQWEKSKNNILFYFEINPKEYNSFKNNFNI